VKLYTILSPNVAGKMAKAAMDMEWEAGKARTKELTGTVKQNLEILSSSNRVAEILLKDVGVKMMSHASIQLDCIPLMIHTPKFSKYAGGGHYKTHTDAPWMGSTRTDLSCTLWLSEPDAYEGGELCIGGNTFKGKPGEALIYECGVPHEVRPVTKGERVCVVTWIQSRIRDSAKRKLISDFRKWLAKMESNPTLFSEGSTIYSALLRRWME